MQWPEKNIEFLWGRNPSPLPRSPCRRKMGETEQWEVHCLPFSSLSLWELLRKAESGCTPEPFPVQNLHFLCTLFFTLFLFKSYISIAVDTQYYYMIVFRCLIHFKSEKQSYCFKSHLGPVKIGIWSHLISSKGVFSPTTRASSTWAAARLDVNWFAPYFCPFCGPFSRIGFRRSENVLKNNKNKTKPWKWDIQN